ncbi:flagellar biosynthesis protein FlaG [Pyrobaculum sp.]|uniref:flagellar biosynthesis protein FlaG n=1 Tax=Pyrobaculum sp. TaxID=2004705 RepID=UPI003D0DC247
MKTETKGLEPIVAAVLLIVVAVIGAVLVYLWFAGYVTKATSQAEQMAASEKLKIEAANLTSGTPVRASLYIRNLGGDNVTIATVYILKPGTINPLCVVDGSQVTYYKSTSTTSAQVNSLYPGSVQLVRFSTSGCGVSSGFDYVIKLVTKKGTEFAVTVTAS